MRKSSLLLLFSFKKIFPFFLQLPGHCLTINGTSCLTLPKRFKSTERSAPHSALLIHSLSFSHSVSSSLLVLGGEGRTAHWQCFRFRWLHKSLGSPLFCGAPLTIFPYFRTNFMPSSCWNDRNLSGNVSFCLVLVWRPHLDSTVLQGLLQCSYCSPLISFASCSCGVLFVFT